MVLENNGVNIESTDEILEGAEYDNGMIVCVDESERKWRESCLLYTSFSLPPINFELKQIY